MLERNLHRLDELIRQTLAEVHDAAVPSSSSAVFPLAAFIAEAASIAGLYASQKNCRLVASVVDPSVAIRGHREPLLAALNNLLQNAFKFTRPGSDVTLRAHAADGRISIEVGDECGGLPTGAADRLFEPFTQASADRRGLGLGLSIAAQSVADHGGSLRVRDVPGHGCVFTIELAAESS